MSEGSDPELRHAVVTPNTRPLSNPLKSLLGLLVAVVLASAIVSAILTAWGLHLAHGRSVARQQLSNLQSQLDQLQRSQASADNSTIAQLNKANEKLATMQAELDKTHAQLDQLRSTLERTEAEKNLFIQQAQQLQNSLDQANANLAKALEELRLSKNQPNQQMPSDPLERAANLTLTKPEQALELLQDKTIFPLAKRDFAWQWLVAQAQKEPVETKSMRLTKAEALSFDRNGESFVAIDADKSLQVYEWDPGAVQLLEKIVPQQSVVMHPDGKFFYTAGADRIVHAWEIGTGRRKLASRPLHSLGITGLGISRDGRWLLSGDSDGVIRIWDANTCLDKFNFRGPVGRVRVLLMTDDAKSVISSAADKTIRVWDVPGKRLHATLVGHSSPILAMALSPDSKYLASTDAVKSLRVWNLTQQEEIGVLNEVAVTALTFSADNTQVIAGTSTGRLLVWDVAQRKKILDWPLVKGQEPIIGLSYSNVRATLVCVTSTGVISRFELRPTNN